MAGPRQRACWTRPWPGPQTPAQALTCSQVGLGSAALLGSFQTSGKVSTVPTCLPGWPTGRVMVPGRPSCTSVPLRGEDQSRAAVGPGTATGPGLQGRRSRTGAGVSGWKAEGAGGQSGGGPVRLEVKLGWGGVTWVGGVVRSAARA